MAKRSGSLSLFQKLVLASIVAGLLPMILGFVLSYSSQRDTIRRTMGSAFQVLAQETGVKLELQINDLMVMAISLAQSDALVSGAAESTQNYEGLDKAAIREQIKRATALWNASRTPAQMNRKAMAVLDEFRVRNTDRFHQLILTDRAGAMVAASPRGRETRYDYSKQIEWESSFDGGRGKRFIGDITWDPVLSAYTLNVAVPVRRDDQIVGVMILIHTVDRLFKSVTDVHIGRTDHTMLASSDGSLLFCPIFQIKNHTLSKTLSQEIFKDQNGWSTTLVDVHYPGREAINGFAPVRLVIENLSPKSLAGQQWFIFTSQNPEETYESLRSLLRWTALSAGMGVFILVILAVLVIRTIVRPITYLRAQAHEIIQRIQALPQDQRAVATPLALPKIEIHTGDEIEDLAQTFSEMVGALERTRQDLGETTRRLEAMAITDDLTGLYNRRHVMEELKAEFSRSVRFELPLSCLAIDLDFFKAVNDSYGHLAGDQVLRQISALFRKNFREPDIMARVGGEEFLVILPQTDIHGALAKAEWLRNQVERNSFTVDSGKTRRMTVSIGVAAYPDDRIQNMDQLIKLADDALYQSKESGRNRVSRG